MCPNNTVSSTAAAADGAKPVDGIATRPTPPPNARIVHFGEYGHFADVDATAVIKCATVDVADLEWTAPTRDGYPARDGKTPSTRSMPMDGFDASPFRDIVDYILKITYWIWHERKVDLCLEYYGRDCRLHTVVGDVVGADAVVAGTNATLAVFPDRTLDGENVVWSVDGWRDRRAYYSSHMITSHMTHSKAVPEWNDVEASFKTLRVRTIADCVCVENRIVEEWLMRDNAHIAVELGIDVDELAARQAREDAEAGKASVVQLLEPERRRVRAQSLHADSCPKPARAEDDPIAFGKSWLVTFWLKRDYARLAEFYDYRVAAHVTLGAELYGPAEYRTRFAERVASRWSEVTAVALDHVAAIPYLGSEAIDVAYRWTLTATHGDSGAPAYLLASTHARIVNGRIREEWTIFDELGLAKQVQAHKLLTAQE